MASQWGSAPFARPDVCPIISLNGEDCEGSIVDWDHKKGYWTCLLCPGNKKINDSVVENHWTETKVHQERVAMYAENTWKLSKKMSKACTTINPEHHTISDEDTPQRDKEWVVKQYIKDKKRFEAAGGHPQELPEIVTHMSGELGIDNEEVLAIADAPAVHRPPEMRGAAPIAAATGNFSLEGRVKDLEAQVEYLTGQNNDLLRRVDHLERLTHAEFAVNAGQEARIATLEAVTEQGAGSQSSAWLGPETWRSGRGRW